MILIQSIEKFPVESRCVSRAASRAHSRAPSPALSMRSRTSRRKPRSPTPSLPSSDADSESELGSDRVHIKRVEEKIERKEKEIERKDKEDVKESESDLGPAPQAPNTTWQCEHCTFVNDPGVRVCVVCCRTPTITPKIITSLRKSMEKLNIGKAVTPSPVVTKVINNTGLYYIHQILF